MFNIRCNKLHWKPPSNWEIHTHTHTHTHTKERSKEGNDLTIQSTHFIYGYVAWDIWYRTTQIAREETRCHHMSYSFQLVAKDLLYASSHREDSTYHGLCYISRGAMVGTRNSSTSPPWGIDPMTHHTMSRCSTVKLHLTPYTHTHTPQAHTHTYTTSTHTHIHKHTQTCTRSHTNRHLLTHTHTHTPQAHAHTHTHTHTQTHTNMHSLTHTHSMVRIKQQST